MRTRTLLITLAVAMLPLTASAQETETKGPDLETTIQWIENMIKKNGEAIVSDAALVEEKDKSGSIFCTPPSECNETTTISGTMLTTSFKGFGHYSYFHSTGAIVNTVSKEIAEREPGRGIVEQRLDLSDLTSVTQKDDRKVCLETNEKVVEAVVVRHDIVDHAEGGRRGVFVGLSSPAWLRNIYRSLKPEGTTGYTNSMCFRLEQEEHAKKLVKAFEHVKTLLQSGSKGSAHDKDLF